MTVHRIIRFNSQLKTKTFPKQLLLIKKETDLFGGRDST